MEPLLQIRNLRTVFESEAGVAAAVDGVDLDIRRGEVMGLVGESGCGKSVTAFSIMRLVAQPGRIVSGQVLFEGKDLLKLDEPEMRRMRGNRISMIFQEPMTSLNPVFRVGDQIAEVYRLHRNMNGKDALRAATEMLQRVGIPSPERRVWDYPHQLSGGMRQRVVIAMALACDPRLMLADEPTTALDVTIQAQILDLMTDIKTDKGTGILLITHDLGVVAEMADRVAVMYTGKIVEEAPVQSVFDSPQHPYTIGLLQSIPRIVRGAATRARLHVISGTVPDLRHLPTGCSFQDRCPEVGELCMQPPTLDLKPSGHHVRCWMR
jgi:oligopeptide/dipeptide ABC transporter ATP-binding protein